VFYRAILYNAFQLYFTRDKPVISHPHFYILLLYLYVGITYMYTYNILFILYILSSSEDSE